MYFSLKVSNCGDTTFITQYHILEGHKIQNKQLMVLEDNKNKVHYSSKIMFESSFDLILCPKLTKVEVCSRIIKVFIPLIDNYIFCHEGDISNRP